MHGLLRATALVALAATFVVSMRRGAPPPDGVILVLVDALRADRLGCYGYRQRPTSPHLDRLATDGTRFANAISSTPWTLPTLATIFTGLYPSVHGATLASDINKWLADQAGFKPTNALAPTRTTLAEVLHAHGFATAGFIVGSYPSPEFGVAQGFARYDANLQSGIRFQLDALFDWLDRERPQRFFAYLHTGEVHSPYTPPPLNPRWSADDPDPAVRAVAQALEEERARYRRFDFDPGYTGWLDGSWASLGAIRRRKRTPDARDVAHLHALYDRGIAYTDYWIGALVDGLQRRGLYDRTILVITSDHGDELLDHGGIEHTRTYYEEMMRVPLLIRVPGVGIGRTVEQQVGLVDITPTVLNALDVPSALPFQGRSLMPLIEGRTLPALPILGEASQRIGLKALRTERWKYIRAPDGTQQLFDLHADSGEHTDVCPLQPETCSALGRDLAALEAENAGLAQRLALPAPVPAEVDAAARERLRSLGYAE